MKTVKFQVNIKDDVESVKQKQTCLKNIEKKAMRSFGRFYKKWNSMQILQ